jgi:hypothetical protein
MPYVCNLSKDNQLSIIEKIAHNLQGDNFPDSVEQVILNALHSKIEDLEDSLKHCKPMSLCNDKASRTLACTIFRSTIESEIEKAIREKTNLGSLLERMMFLQRTMQRVTWLFDHPKDCESLHFCNECGKMIFEGYSIAGNEFYCSDECLHNNYCPLEYLAMYAGLDYTSEEALQQVENMSDKEIDALHESNDSECFWTEWEAY